MNKLTYILSFLVLILSVWTVILWMRPSGKDRNVVSEARYGVIEGLQLVERTMVSGGKQYFVEDADGDVVFRIPLSGCLSIPISATVSCGSGKWLQDVKDI